MTAEAKRRLALAVLVPVLAALSWPLIRTASGAAWGLKVNTSTFRDHLRDEQLRAALDSAWHADQTQLILDVLCSVKPADRRCR